MSDDSDYDSMFGETSDDENGQKDEDGPFKYCAEEGEEIPAQTVKTETGNTGCTDLPHPVFTMESEENEQNEEVQCDEDGHKGDDGPLKYCAEEVEGIPVLTVKTETGNTSCTDLPHPVFTMKTEENVQNGEAQCDEKLPSQSITSSSPYIDESLFESSSDDDNDDNNEGITQPVDERSLFESSSDCNNGGNNEIMIDRVCKNSETDNSCIDVSKSIISDKSTPDEVGRHLTSQFMSHAIPKKKRTLAEMQDSTFLWKNQTDEIDRSSPSKHVLQHRHPTNMSIIKRLRPDQYPTFNVEQFSRTLRSWDFVNDLNDYMNKQTRNNSCTIESPDRGNDDHNVNNDVCDTARASSFSNCSSSNTSHIPPLPDSFDSHQQYVALWAPLQLRETKAQILSELCSFHPPLVPVKVSPDLNSIKDQNSECITLRITRNDQHSIKGAARLEYGRYSKSGMISRFHENNKLSKNDFVLLVTDITQLEMAWKGRLFKKEKEMRSTKKKKVSWSPSLVLLTSPLIENRLGIMGCVLQGNNILDKKGFMVQVSRFLWRKSAVQPSDMFLLTINHNATAWREFKALCNVKKMPLMEYLLKPKRNLGDKPSPQLGIPNGPLSETGGQNALGIGFRIWVKSRFNNSQLGAINAAAREYGDGGFTLVKGPPGTGKTSTLVALINALHCRQYQRYYSEIERITLAGNSENSMSETLAAIKAAAKVKPRILVCAPSNSAVDNIILKIVENRFVDGNGGKYSPSVIRVGNNASTSVVDVSLNHTVESVSSERLNIANLQTSVQFCKKEAWRLQKEIHNLQKRVRLIAKASPHSLSTDWEIRIDEDNFEHIPRVIFVNHKLKTVTLSTPPPPDQGQPRTAAKEMPHYRECMNSLVKYIERHSAMNSKLEQRILLQNAATTHTNANHANALNDLNQQLETHVLDSAHIVLTTLGSAGSKTMEKAAKFEVVVVDEAAQSSEPATLAALQLGSSHAILVGDPQQLPATIFSVSGRVTKYDRSLFQRLEDSGHSVNMLNTQYRMAPKISAFPRRIFYEGSLLDGPNVLAPDYGDGLSRTIMSAFPYVQPFTVFDINSAEERGGTSLSNSVEAQFALHLFCSLAESTTGITKKSRVAIITPYQQQVHLLRSTFESNFGNVYNRMVDISTVDAYQGKEADIVIFSCVRAARKEIGIGFLSDVQRMNVALTRSKHFLFVIARCRTILVNPYWRDLVNHANQQGAIIKVEPNRRNIIIQGRKSFGRTSTNNLKGEEVFPDLRTLKPIYNDDNANLPCI